MKMAGAESASPQALWPRNVSVPAYRPLQSSGCPACVRQCVSGPGEGQHPCPGRDARRQSQSRRGGPIHATGSRATASGRLGVRDVRRWSSQRTRPRRIPRPSRWTSGASAPRFYAWRDGRLSDAVCRRGRESPARADWWAKAVKALPLRWVFAPRAGSCWPAGLPRRDTAAASEKAHVRSAGPLFGPERPSRGPAAALARFPRRQYAPHARPRGKRWRSWLA
jgi:hypothetical protein